jgi:hypothetical protein
MRKSFFQRGCPSEQRKFANASPIESPPRSKIMRALACLDFRNGSMLSKKSKIEQLPKSRETRFLAAAASASLCRTRTKLCGRLLVIRRSPSHRRAPDAPAALKNFLHPPEKPFSTVSVKTSPCHSFRRHGRLPQ